MSSKGKKGKSTGSKKRVIPIVEAGEEGEAASEERETKEERLPVDASKIATRAVVPTLVVDGGVRMLQFYRDAFGAEVTNEVEAKDGRLEHSEMMIFGSKFYVSDDFPEWRRDRRQHAPHALGGSPVAFQFFVPDVDAAVAKAVAAGAVVEMKPRDQYWGDRYARVRDPAGHSWAFATPLAGGPESWPPRNSVFLLPDKRDEEQQQQASTKAKSGASKKAKTKGKAAAGGKKRK